ncbi:MAG TPA: NAD-dependent deacylase [Candidatus Sulfomarinibacteraceae bacterium]|nr:NAD-dependent deacylase [Candidatus Sulfomarinibacteraceae bacterium]
MAAALNDLIQDARRLLSGASHVVALTGAGISTPSGIPDFRSPASGLWEQVDPLQVASLFAFRQRPQDFYDWIYPLTRTTLAARPNAAHLALAQMEEHGPLQAVITQNIDMLHSKAGSQNIIEIHGHMRELTCLRCYDIVPSEPVLERFLESGEAPRCSCGGVLKPNVILFGEQLPVRALTESKRQARQCDLMLVVGSSLEVAPAGDLPLLARDHGARLIIVNYGETYADHIADVVLHADVVEVLPQLAAPFLR